MENEDELWGERVPLNLAAIPMTWWDQLLDYRLYRIHLPTFEVTCTLDVLRQYCYRRARQRGIQIRVQTSEEDPGAAFVQAHEGKFTERWGLAEALEAPPVPTVKFRKPTHTTRGRVPRLTPPVVVTDELAVILWYPTSALLNELSRRNYGYTVVRVPDAALLATDTGTHPRLSVKPGPQPAPEPVVPDGWQPAQAPSIPHQAGPVEPLIPHQAGPVEPLIPAEAADQGTRDPDLLDQFLASKKADQEAPKLPAVHQGLAQASAAPGAKVPGSSYELQDPFLVDMFGSDAASQGPDYLVAGTE